MKLALGCATLGLLIALTTVWSWALADDDGNPYIAGGTTAILLVACGLIAAASADIRQ